MEKERAELALVSVEKAHALHLKGKPAADGCEELQVVY